MTLEQFKSLTEDELAMLLFLCNDKNAPILPYEITEDILLYVKHTTLCNLLLKSEPNLTDEGKPIFTCLKTKLGISS